METVVLKMLFIVGLSVSGMQIGKHVYVHDPLTWHEAQEYCRAHFTDLTPISDRWQESRLKNATIGKVEGDFWIGLYFDKRHWKWSGGGRATDIPWASGKAGNSTNERGVRVCWHGCKSQGWHSYALSNQLPFLCINLMVIKSTATWEQALQHCRGRHTDLTSLTSETEHLLALSKIQHNDDITEWVWIGLRYLDDGWLWVNNDLLKYEAWSQGGDQDHLCPIQRRCGALTKGGVWENWDCQDRHNMFFVQKCSVKM